MLRPRACFSCVNPSALSDAWLPPEYVWVEARPASKSETGAKVPEITDEKVKGHPQYPSSVKLRIVCLLGSLWGCK